MPHQAKANLPADALSFTPTLLPDRYADDQTAGKQLSCTFSRINAAAVPVRELGSMAILLAGRGVVELLARQGLGQAHVST